MIRRSHLLAIPTALLATACGATEALIPPSATAENWEQVPLTRKVLVPTVQQTGANWLQKPENPWAAYQKATLITSLDTSEHTVELPHIEELDVVVDAEQAARAVSLAGLPERAMWIVDLRGAASVAFGATLSENATRPVTTVLTFNNWPAQNELIPAEEALAALVTMQPRFPPSGDAGQPVFLLDAWRLAFRNEEPRPEVTDNRYMLTPSDLPDAATLLSQGIDQILYVVEDTDRTSREEDDLHETFLAYQQAGIAIAIVDLRWLQALDGPGRWERPSYDYPALSISPGRRTLVRDPVFFHRARSGFGGIRVISSGMAGGHGGAHGTGHGGGG